MSKLVYKKDLSGCNKCFDVTEEMYSTYDGLYCSDCMKEYDWDYLEELDESNLVCATCREKIILSSCDNKFLGNYNFWKNKYSKVYCQDCYNVISVTNYETA